MRVRDLLVQGFSEREYRGAFLPGIGHEPTFAHFDLPLVDTHHNTFIAPQPITWAHAIQPPCGQQQGFMRCATCQAADHFQLCQGHAPSSPGGIRAAPEANGSSKGGMAAALAGKSASDAGAGGAASAW